MCPAGLDNPLTATHPSPDQLDQWALRGAINAGFSVFLYLESLAKNGGPDPDYTECDKLPATASTSGK